MFKNFDKNFFYLPETDKTNNRDGDVDNDGWMENTTALVSKKKPNLENENMNILFL